MKQSKFNQKISSFTLLSTLLMAFGFFSLLSPPKLKLIPEVLAQTASNSKAEADRLLQEANEYLSAGKYTLAANNLERALAIYQEIQDSQGEEQVLNTLATTYLKLGATDKAYPLATRIYQLREENAGTAQIPQEENSDRSISEEQKTALNELYQGAFSIKKNEFNEPGDSNDAITHLENSLAAFRNAGDRRGEAGILTALGTIYMQDRKYSKGIEYLEESLALSNEYPSELENSGIRKGNIFLLGEAHFQQGNNTQALEYFQQSLELAKQEADNKDLSSSLIALGKVYVALGENDRAIAYAREALAQNQARASSEQDLDRQGRALTILGTALWKSNRLTEAEDTFRQAMKVFEQSRQVELASNSEDELAKIKSFQAQASVSPNLQQVLIAQNKIEEALEIAEWGRARVTTELLARKSSSSDDLPPQQPVQNPTSQNYCQRQAQQLEQYSSSLPPEQARQMAGKMSDFEQQCQQIYQSRQQQIQQHLENSPYAPFLSSSARILSAETSPPPAIAPPNIAKIQQLAREQEATIVEYSIVAENDLGKINSQEDKLLIWVVQPTGKVTFRQVDLTQNKLSLTALVNNSRCFNNQACRGENEQQAAPVATRSIPFSTEAHNEQARDVNQDASGDLELKELHSLLIEPIADLLPPDENQEVIFIPHKSLFLVPFAALKDSGGQYLVEKHSILTVPAIELLDLAAQKDRALQQNNSTFNATIVGNPTMPSMGEPPQQLPSLDDAGKEAQEIARLFNTQAVLGNQATKTSVLETISQANLIHLATHGVIDDLQGFGIPGAIALAPDNRSNGWLTSSEILDLDLKAELAVLSACNTGRGDLTGDGVIGLSRSFISAGVPNLIVSLWQVPDGATADLMTVFYQNLKTEPSKAKALRQAMLSAIAQNKDPSSWAAFSLIGSASAECGICHQIVATP